MDWYRSAARELGPPGLGDILKNITLVFLASYVYCMQCMFLCVSLVSLDFNCLRGMDLVIVQKRVNMADLRVLLLERPVRKVGSLLASRNFVLEVLSQLTDQCGSLCLEFCAKNTV